MPEEIEVPFEVIPQDIWDSAERCGMTEEIMRTYEQCRRAAPYEASYPLWCCAAHEWDI